jgi:hypothetical protein
LLTKLYDVVFTDLTSTELAGTSRRVRAVGRLLSLLGVVLFFGLAVEGLTVLSIGRMVALHIILGMVLVPLMIYKITVATYRFAMYYLGARDFKRAGPPELLLRAIGPILVLSTLVMLASGIVLAFLPPSSEAVVLWRYIHQVSFIIWFALLAIHVLAYLRRAFGTASYDFRSSRYHYLVGRNGRLISIGLAIFVGLGLGAVVYPEAVHWAQFFNKIGLG